MATYISLVQFTDKGIQAAKQTTKRIADWAAEVQSKGVSVKQMYWTLGQYDQVCVIEAPDDETAASVLLTADMLGNIRTQTMRMLPRPPRWIKSWPRCPKVAVPAYRGLPIRVPKGVSLSSTRTTKSFASPRCTSTRRSFARD